MRALVAPAAGDPYGRDGSAAESQLIAGPNELDVGIAESAAASPRSAVPVTSRFCVIQPCIAVMAPA